MAGPCVVLPRHALIDDYRPTALWPCGAPPNSPKTHKAWNGVWCFGGFSGNPRYVTCGGCRRVMARKGLLSPTGQAELPL